MRQALGEHVVPEAWKPTEVELKDYCTRAIVQMIKSPLKTCSLMLQRGSWTSLSVPLERPQIASPKMHRSVLSLSLRCSSHQLTADGVDSSANGEPISTALSQELSEGKQDLLGPQWGQPQGGHWKESPALVPVHLGSGTCPRTGSPPLENVKFADVGRNQVPVRKEKEDHATCTSSSHTNQLSIHIPGWSYRADYTCCDLVVKLKECEKNEDPTVTPEPSPATPSPSTPEGAQSSDPSEDSYEPLLASSMTLQEALEVHRPQFISRSQERLQKLKRMVQQRKTQQKESLGQKQSLLPVRANKKQFTIPHPLSDNLFKPKERCISEKEMHMRSKRYLAIVGSMERAPEGFGELEGPRCCPLGQGF